MSVPRKIMYSNTSSRGGTGRSVGLSSVPKERTGGKKMTVYKLEMGSQESSVCYGDPRSMVLHVHISYAQIPDVDSYGQKNFQTPISGFGQSIPTF
jgi:hypothetical protein